MRAPPEHLTLQVGGDIALGEGAEPLGAVGAVELDGGAGHLAGALQRRGRDCAVRTASWHARHGGRGNRGAGKVG